MNLHRRAVAITGVGAITPVGSTAAATFDALCRGENGIRDIPAWKQAGFPVTYGGLVPETEALQAADPELASFNSRKAVFAVHALREALQQAGEGALAGKGGVFLGIETGRIDIQKLFRMFAQAGTPKGLDLRAFGEKCFQYLTPQEALSKQPFFIAHLVAKSAGVACEARSVSNACSSANQAIGEAFRKVASGQLDWAITGGADDMVDEYMAIGFHLLGALAEGGAPETASRPFDAGRKGFVLGEGAGMLVFESLEHAQKRGARPLALISGYGSGASAGRITETTWEGIHQTMSQAVESAGLAPDDIDYINAHGTSTPMNDPAESEAIRRFLGSRAKIVPVSSTKSMIGHLIAASGAVEAVVCAQSLALGRVHPTRNYVKPDPHCDLDYVTEGARDLPLRHALSNSLGFAGINSTLLFSRC
jgi:3-oxoacyl-[acyl-carrier-protein] synthase II